jgi:CheY-like chemotaxis protein
VRDLGAVLLVNDDTAAVIRLYTNVLESKAVSVWATTDSNKDNVSVEL